jgi:hypothetical protein
MRVTILRTLVLLLALLATSPAAGAGTLRLEFGDGYVTISAVSVPLRQVLTEWARLGQTRVVNAEKLGGAPLTIELSRVPEKQALEILLRSVPGYMAARRATFVPGGSQFDRIVVMPGTVAPPSQAATPPPPAPPPPAPPPTPMPAAAVDDQDEPVPQENPDQAGAAEPDQDQDQPQPQPEPGQQPQTLPSPGVQPLPPAPPGQQNDGDGVPPQQPAGPTAVPGGGAVVSPNPGQLPLPPAKPPNQQDQ